MKRLLALTAATATIAMTGTAMAATANLTVTASITNACSITGGTLSFGSLDTLSPSNVTATSSGVTVTCTKGDNYTVAVDHGVNASSGTQAYLSNGTDKIAYSVSVPTLSAGTGSAQTIALAGSITASAYTMASAGDYSDTMTITVTP